MKITCTNCHAIIPAENIDFSRNIAKCSLCDNVFNCQEQLSSVGSQETGEKTRTPDQTKQEVLLPGRMKISQLDNGFQMAIKWFSAKFIFLTIFCIFWDGFMIVWYSIAISEGIIAMAAFGTIHALVGIVLTYYTIGGYINWTVINITRDQVAVKIGPLPFPGNMTIEARNIDQLYCKDKITRGRNGSTTVTFEVHLNTRDGKNLKLVKGLDNDQQAFYIEQEIEKYLNIRDTQVRGEMSR